MTIQFKKGTPDISPAGEGEDKPSWWRISIPVLLRRLLGAVRALLAQLPEAPRGAAAPPPSLAAGWQPCGCCSPRHAEFARWRTAGAAMALRRAGARAALPHLRQPAATQLGLQRHMLRRTDLIRKIN